MRDFDPSAPLVARDGYEYRDLGDCILSKHADTKRNGNIRCYRAYGYREDAVLAYARGFDEGAQGERFLGPGKLFGEAHRHGLAAAYLTGGFGPKHLWREPGHPRNKEDADRAFSSRL